LVSTAISFRFRIGAAVVVVFQFASTRGCFSSGVLFLFCAAIALASSPVVGVEVLDLTSSWWFGRCFGAFVALFFNLGVWFLDCFLMTVSW
jgi:hypothetical protein